LFPLQLKIILQLFVGKNVKISPRKN